MPELGEAQVAVRAKLDKLDNDLSKAKRKVEESAGGLDKILDNVGKAAKGALIGFGLSGAAQLAMDLQDVGTESLRTRSSLDALTEGQADAYIESVRASVRGTVTDMEAARIANRLYGMGLVDTAEKAGEMARVSAILGATFSNLGAADAADDIALMLANMSYARLDTFGVSSGRVRTRVQELKAEMPGLTTEAAFTEAAMEALSQKADTLEFVLGDQAEGVEGLKVEWRELREEVGEYVAVTSGPVIKAINHEIDSYEHARDSARELHREIARNSSSYAEFAQAVIAANRQLTDGQRQHMQYQQQFATAGYYEDLIAEIDSEVEALSRAEQAELERAQHYIQQQNAMADATRDWAAEAQMGLLTTEELSQAYLDGALTLEQYEAGKRSLMTVEQQAAAMARDEAAALQEQAKAADEAYRAQKGLRDFVAGLAQDQEQYGGALARSGAGFDNFISFLEDSGMAAGLNSDQIDQWAVSYGALTPEQLQQKQLLGDLEQAMTRYDETFTPEEWRAAFDLVQTGQLNAAQAALDNEAAQARVVNKLTVMSGQADTTAGDSEDAMGRVGDAFEEAAAAMVPARDHLDSIANRISWIKRNSDINININTNGSGPDVGGTTRRAAGGPVYPGQGYLVGEQGPEFFMPDTAGAIIPNHAMGSADMLHEMGAAGGTQVVFNFYPTVNAPAGLMDPAVAERLAWDLARPIVQEIRNSGQLRELLA